MDCQGSSVFVSSAYKMSSENDVLDTYAAVTSKNKEEMAKEIAKAKPEKINLLKSVIQILEEKDVKYWLDNGTLLGAFRNGQMIPHDFDLDLAVFGEDNLNLAHQGLEEVKPEGYIVRKGHHDPENVPICKKCEIYKELEQGYGCTDPKNVSMDIAMYEYADDKMKYCKTEYHGFGLEKNRFKSECIFPLGKIKFEGLQLPCPNNPQAYLEVIYGYIGPDCYYDKTTCKYRKRGT